MPRQIKSVAKKNIVVQNSIFKKMQSEAVERNRVIAKADKLFNSLGYVHRSGDVIGTGESVRPYLHTIEDNAPIILFRTLPNGFAIDVQSETLRHNAVLKASYAYPISKETLAEIVQVFTVYEKACIAAIPRGN